jgi:hypothetical protein
MLIASKVIAGFGGMSRHRLKVRANQTSQRQAEANNELTSEQSFGNNRSANATYLGDRDGGRMGLSVGPGRSFNA